MDDLLEEREKLFEELNSLEGGSESDSKAKKKASKKKSSKTNGVKERARKNWKREIDAIKAKQSKWF